MAKHHPSIQDGGLYKKLSSTCQRIGSHPSQLINVISLMTESTLCEWASDVILPSSIFRTFPCMYGIQGMRKDASLSRL
jgi:hypothetical protein